MKPGVVVMSLGLIIVLIGCLNLLVASYHIHFYSHPHRSGSEERREPPGRETNSIETRRTRPPLSSLIEEYDVTGDVSWLLQFSIVGFPKCGTSSLMYLMKNHSQVDIFTDERCDLAYNKQALLVRDLYHALSPAVKARGIKCPLDLESTAMSLPNYHAHFPRTKLIVGIRHPILWFESFYNFRIHNGAPMPPAEALLGRCRRGMYNVCTFRSNFHLFLANLGKTSVLSDPTEISWFAHDFHRSIKPQVMAQEKGQRPVFLYDVSQLNTQVAQRQFMRDLQQFLELDVPFPVGDEQKMIWFRPGMDHSNQTWLDALNAKKIDICQSKYASLRNILLEQAINASHWISEYFLQAPRVHVSSKSHFISTIMTSWRKDPCSTRPPRRKLADIL